ncbi:prepilin peptidase [Pseudomonas sp. NBRC 111129]|uniref:prepilin peptidase n=1 Tax=Pseudomonas sp. NBRC 111129 TaxID=1661044 RepID=UPI0009EA877B|nr:A24 family peptidase [Pseudomonas sp. NBRC 111129]
MSEWMSSEIILWFATIVLGMLAGRLCVWIASWLPALLEHRWQQEAREILGLDTDTHRISDSRLQGTSSLWLQAVQIGCAALSLVVVWQLGATPHALFALLLTWWLLTLSLIDSEHYLLPDVLVLPGVWFGLILNAFEVFTTMQDAFWGCVVGYLSLWVVSQLVQLINRKQVLGNGDLKLLAMIGAWGGWQILPTTVLFALLTCLLASVPRTLKSSTSRPTVIPFGPYITVAGWASLTFQLNTIL